MPPILSMSIYISHTYLSLYIRESSCSHIHTSLHVRDSLFGSNIRSMTSGSFTSMLTGGRGSGNAPQPPKGNDPLSTLNDVTCSTGEDVPPALCMVCGNACRGDGEMQGWTTNGDVLFLGTRIP